MDLVNLIDQENSLSRFGLLVERLPDGTLRANVAHVRHHSPTGFECGYRGSGPADLALSVLHALLPPLAPEDENRQYELPSAELEAALDDPARWSETLGPDRVRVSCLAYSLHQEFKEEFIATMPREGGHIPIEVIQSWIAARIPSRSSLDAGG